MAEQIQVIVQGAMGRMGAEVVRAVCQNEGMVLVGATGRQDRGSSFVLPGDYGSIAYSTDLSTLVKKLHPSVIVDFTNNEGALSAVRVGADAGVSVVSGSTGMGPESVERIRALAEENEIGVVLAPNFALGAVLLTYLARQVGRHFEFAEIIELHHEGKIDAPSGTSLATARALVEGRGTGFSHNHPEKETLPGTRGGDHEGIAIHSVRLPGLMAHQEVILGAAGQTLTLRHDAINRECYMPGVLMAIRKTIEASGLIYGMEALLGLVEAE